MYDDLSIEFLNQTHVNTNYVQLPSNFETVGKIDPDDLKVYIHQDVYLGLETYATIDMSKEVGSILLGDYTQKNGTTSLIITDYIEAKFADASASTLTFTHETWNYIHKEHERLNPDKKIVGWQHTHPNYGIFLSTYDLFIQENFFNLDFQVAYVIDPLRKQRGFFQNKNGKAEELNGFYVFDVHDKSINL